jgi:hypothetical protein
MTGHQGEYIMFDHFQNVQLSQLRREEILEDLQNARMAQVSAGDKGGSLPFYAPVLSALGDALVNAGSTLQSRYSDVREAYEAQTPRTAARPTPSTAK